MISDISKGLFHKAIMMSGTALNPWVSLHHQFIFSTFFFFNFESDHLQSIGPLENVPERVAKLLGWNGEGGIHRAMKELLKASPASLVRAQNLLLGKEVIDCNNLK